MRHQIPYHVFLIVALLQTFLCVNLYAQKTEKDTLQIRVRDINPRTVTIDDTVWVISGICKPLRKIKYKGDVSPTIVVIEEPAKPIPFLTISGNIQYDFLYRSYVDTPFAQNDFQQHTIRTSLSIVVKDKYPMKLNLYTRQSNSPFFRNFFDAGLLFDPSTYARNAKQSLLNQIAEKKLKMPDFVKLEEELANLVDKYNSLKNRLRDPDINQLIIEEREREYLQARELLQPADPALSVNELNRHFTYKNMSADKPIDTSALIKNLRDNRYAEFIMKKQHELDSLGQRIKSLNSKVDSTKNAINNNIQNTRQKIYKAGNRRQLQKIAAENGLKTEKHDGIDNFLADVKSIGVGRSVVNYSELTAWNVSLTGFNMEYNPPGVYAAVGAGKIDYGFRDFLGKNANQKNQELFIGRIGIGDRDQHALIFSAYTGKKYNYGGILPDTISDNINITGYSLEAIWKKNESNGIIAEIAKSTKPVIGSAHTGTDWNSLVSMSDNSNLGISVKAKAEIPETDTRFTGFFRKTGQYFQSFSLFTYNTDQTAWSVKADQSLLRKKISVMAMLRRNDFVNPFTIKTFKTSTVFTSLQTTLRFPKWPVISAGYFPGTQLYIEDKERVRENAYYIINGSVVYSYNAGGSRMVSSFIYNQYSSKGTDTGFISYNGINYMASQMLTMRKAQLQASFTYNDQEQMRYSTVEANADYSPISFIRAGVGVKYNKVNGGASYWGNRAQLTIELKSLGGLQLQYEKSYLPTIYQSLFPIETGRVSWFKYF